MRTCASLARFGVVVTLAAGTASAQVLLERAILTSGVSSIAGPSAKKAGDGVGAVLSRTNDVLAGAAAQGAAPGTQPAAQPVQQATESEVAAARAATAAAYSTYRQPAPTPIPEASRSALEKIEVGTTRQDLIAQAGRPASRITIPEEGRLFEIYQYWSRGAVVASIRLTNGTVSSIDLR